MCRKTNNKIDLGKKKKHELENKQLSVKYRRCLSVFCNSSDSGCDYFYFW